MHKTRKEVQSSSPHLKACRTIAIRACFVAGAAVTCLPTVARAEATAQEKAAAEALFDNGQRLMEEGDYASACVQFEQSQSVDPGVGTLLYLAECYEMSNRLASAWAIFREASSAARAAGQADRSLLASNRASQLNPQLSYLALVVPQAESLPGLEVLLDGRLVSRALHGVAYPVDAGRHELLVRAPGYVTNRGALEIPENGDRKNFSVPALEKVEPRPAASTAGALATRVSPLPASSPSPSSSAGGNATVALRPSYSAPAPGSELWQRPSSGAQDRALGIVIGGAGFVSVGVGALFGLRAVSKDNDSKEYCYSNGGCWDTLGEIRNDEARSSALIANMAYGLGAVALGTGAWFYFTASGEPASGAVGVGPLLGATQGVELRGNF